MMNDWRFLVLVGAFLFSIVTLIRKILIKKLNSDPILFSGLYSFFVGLYAVILQIILEKKFFLVELKLIWINLILMILLNSGAIVLAFIASKAVEVSKFTVIFSMRILLIALISSLVLHEGLSLIQWDGSVLILLAIILVNITAEKLKFSVKEGIVFLATWVESFAIINDRVLLKSLDPYTFTSLSFITTGLCIISLRLFVLKTIQRKEKNNLLLKSDLIKLLLMALLATVVNICIFSAIHRIGNAARVMSIYSIHIIFDILLALCFLKETENKMRKIFAAMISFTGVLLLINHF